MGTRIRVDFLACFARNLCTKRCFNARPQHSRYVLESISLAVLRMTMLYGPPRVRSGSRGMSDLRSPGTSEPYLPRMTGLPRATGVYECLGLWPAAHQGQSMSGALRTFAVVTQSSRISWRDLGPRKMATQMYSLTGTMPVLGRFLSTTRWPL